MLWVEFGIALVAAVVAVLATRPKRPRDLGPLSDQWLAQHRRES